MGMADRIIEEDAQTIASADMDWGKLRGKTVLIAGANGYVPQYLVHGLLRRNDQRHDGIKVIALCRNRERAEMRFARYRGRTDFELLLQDVRMPVQIDGNVDYVIHGASPASQEERHENPLLTFEANVEGSRNLLQLAWKKEAVFLLLSSIDIYGRIPGTGRLTEGRYGDLDPLNIRNVYSCAKRAAETLCACYSRRGVPCKIVRPAQILAGGIGLADGRLHIDFISQMLKGDEIVLKGDGTPRRSFLYVTDAVTGMLTVLLRGKSGEAYNLCTEKGEASVLELARLMATQAEGRTIRITYDMESRRSDPAVTQVVSTVCGDSGKIRTLGWEAKVPLALACKRMMSYYGLGGGDSGKGNG